MTNTTASRDSIVDRIRKLAKFTTANGCTEAEAGLAAAKVAALIAEYDVTQDELSLRRDDTGCITDDYTELNATISDWAECCADIAALYGTRGWFKQGSEDALGLGFETPTVRIKYFGLPSDVAACLATSALICVAVNTEAVAFKTRSPNARLDFRGGMVSRLCERLQQMHRERTVAQRSTGTALIVLKDQLVTEEYAKLNMRLRARYGSAPTRQRNADAWVAGRNAGARVDLTGSAKIAQAPLRIGRA
jgi:hypothetical protein